MGCSIKKITMIDNSNLKFASVFFDKEAFIEYLIKGYFFINIFQSAKISNLSACYKMKDLIEEFSLEERYELAGLCKKQLDFFLRGGNVYFDYRDDEKLIHVPNNHASVIESMSIDEEIMALNDDQIKWIQNESEQILLATLYGSRRQNLINNFALDLIFDNNIIFEMYPECTTIDQICYKLLMAYAIEVKHRVSMFSGYSKFDF